MFLAIVIISLIIALINIIILRMVLQRKPIDIYCIRFRQYASFINSICLSTFCIATLIITEAHYYPQLLTLNFDTFLTDIIILSFLFICSFAAIANHFFENFFSPIYTPKIIDKLELFSVYLRPFDIDYLNNSEYRIIKKSNKIFQTFAIANPSILIQNINASRIFANDKEWKSAVSALLEKSQFNIIRVGVTDGCIWELNQIIDYNYCHKTIFLFKKREEYNLLCSTLHNLGYGGMPKLNIKDDNSTLCAIFLKNSSCFDWHFVSLHSNSEITNLFNSYLHYKPKCQLILNKMKSCRKSFTNIFSWNNYLSFQKNGLSFAGLFPLPFLIIGKVKGRSLFVSLLLIFYGIRIATIIKMTFPIYIVAAIFCLFGSQMSIISNNWAGYEIIRNRINYFLIVCITTMILAYALSLIFLNLHA